MITYTKKDKRHQKRIVSDAIAVGYRQAITEVSKKYYLSQLKVGEFADSTVQNMFIKTKENLCKAKDKHYAYFVTVCPPDDVPLEKLKERIAKCLTKQWVEHCYYVYEQRGTEPGQYKGIHSHLLIKRGNKKPSHGVRELQNTFKPWIIDIKGIPYAWYQDKLDYINGPKTGDGKAEKQKNDVCFRKYYKLQDLYEYTT